MNQVGVTSPQRRGAGWLAKDMRPSVGMPPLRSWSISCVARPSSQFTSTWQYAMSNDFYGVRVYMGEVLATSSWVKSYNKPLTSSVQMEKYFTTDF